MRALTGSNHGPIPGALPIGPVAGDQSYEVTVLLRRRPDAPPFPDPRVIGMQPIAERKYLSAEDFDETYGASQDDVDAVRSFLAAKGLTVTDVHIGKRTLTVSGLAAQFATALGVNLQVLAHAGGAYRGYVGALFLPEKFAGVVLSVVGLDERPIARGPVHPPLDLSAADLPGAHAAGGVQALLHVCDKMAGLEKESDETVAAAKALGQLADAYAAFAKKAADLDAAAAAKIYTQDVQPAAQRASDAYSAHLEEQQSRVGGTLGEAARRDAIARLQHLGIKTPPQIAQLYEFPEDTDGSGQTIGIVELGGGYLRSDLEAYFAFLGLPMIDISDVEVCGGANRPSRTDTHDPIDGEVALDIEVIGGAAPGAKVVVYFAPLHARGFVDAVHAALHDKDARPDVLSISWDLSEGFWLQAPMHILHLEELFTEAAALGVTILCSAGDYGSATTYHDGRLWVDYPASSPLAIGCGGTTLYSRRNTVLLETVWNTFADYGQATGGGVSQVFPPEDWQASADVPESLNLGGGRGRGVPDMAGNADPSKGYLVHMHGQTTVIGGTSAVAPLFSALIARVNQSLGKAVGYINPLLYTAENKHKAFHDVKLGGNGTYFARPGWDPCTGLGRPKGSALRDLLRDAGSKP